MSKERILYCMNYDYLITASGGMDREGVISAFLAYAKMEDVRIKCHISFKSFLETLPDSPIPGFAAAIYNSLQSWGNGCGDISTERLGKSACTTDNPRKLAQAIYDSIADHSMIPFETSSVVMMLISEQISELQNCNPDDGNTVETASLPPVPKRIYKDADGNLYFVRGGISCTTFKGFRRWANPRKGQRREGGLHKLSYTPDKDQAQRDLDAYAQQHGLTGVEGQETSRIARSIKGY